MRNRTVICALVCTLISGIAAALLLLRGDIRGRNGLFVLWLAVIAGVTAIGCWLSAIMKALLHKGHTALICTAVSLISTAVMTVRFFLSDSLNGLFYLLFVLLPLAIASVLHGSLLLVLRCRRKLQGKQAKS